jgi:hypothetical protein
MMAKNSEFEEEMRKSDTAAYRAGLADEPGTESTAAFMKRTGTKATRPKATVGGPKIVTKEQMKKKGFDNLRDYLNAERNLKRRDNFASEAQKRLFATGARGTQTEGSAGEAEARAVAEMRRKAEMPGSKEDVERDAREQATSGGMRKTPASSKSTDTKSPDRPGSEVLAEKMEKGQPKMRAAYGEALENIRKAFAFKKGGKVESTLMGKEGRGMAKATMQKVASKAVKGHESRMHKMKSGGTVSSASKRADGIAMKGKTRGRMV